MKNIVLSLSFVIASTTLLAQNKKTAAADKLYNRYEYVDATQEYLKLVDKGAGDAYVYKQLANSYYNIFNTVEAVKWYAKVIQEDQDAETYYRYAQMLKANGNYEEADKQMNKFASLAPNDQRAKAFKKEPDYLNKLSIQDKLFDVKTIAINSDKSDFGAVLTNDNTLYFASARNTAKKTYGWNAEPFLDIYKVTYTEDGTFGAATAFDELNSKYNDGPLTISTDGNTIYYASESFREHQYVKDADKKLKFSNVNLFKVTKIDGKWGNSTPLPFNSKDYSTSNPSLSKDGKTLYFSSNMPGSIGGIDIWKVAVNADGSFGAPENLGSKINTEGRESFPFITDDNRLYFSSDSHNGFGGLDVFFVDLAKNGEVTNAGKPVNSEKDDFAFSYNIDKKVGFFSSNRTGQDDILLANLLCNTVFKIAVIDAETGKPIPESEIVVLENNKPLESLTANDRGETGTKLPCDKEYVIQVAKVGYEKTVQPILKTSLPQLPLVVKLTPTKVIVTEKEIVLQEIRFEYDKSNITQAGAKELDKLVAIMKSNPTMVILIKAHTDNRGTVKYNLDLSDRRAKATAQYIISKGIEKERISGVGVGENEPKVACDKCTEEQHAINRCSEFIIVKK
jgi:outer membrane protein OmpA-like peptidoglycan-associated protein/tetratricopeptide (TPR) repeat protein